MCHTHTHTLQQNLVCLFWFQGRRHQQEEDDETKDIVKTERGDDEVLSEKRVKLSQSFSEEFKPYDYTSASYSNVGGEGTSFALF